MNHPADTQQKAIELLDRATSTLQVNRTDHQAIAQAIKIFQDVVAENGRLLETIKELNQKVLLNKAVSKVDGQRNGEIDVVNEAKEKTVKT